MQVNDNIAHNVRHPYFNLTFLGVVIYRPTDIVQHRLYGPYRNGMQQTWEKRIMVKTAYLAILASCVLLAIPANAHEFTLSVYGNANMDDLIDENDVEYVQGIIDGDYEETEFSDANYDGQIDEDDLAHIESIISCENVKLKLIDNRGEVAGLDVPVNRVVTSFIGALRPVIHLQPTDKIVGVGSDTLNLHNNALVLQARPELRDLPGIGTYTDPSQEAIVSLVPDVVFGTIHTDKEISQSISLNTGIPFVYANPSTESFDFDEGAFETWRIVGLILGEDEKKRAEELILYCDEKIGEIEEITSEIPEEDKPRIYLPCHSASSLTDTTNLYEPIEIAGGINVAEDLISNDKWGHVKVSKEQIIEWDPEIILINSISKENNWITVDEVLSDPTLKTVSAIKNKRVYNTKAWYAGWDPATGLCECLYLAKLFHPETFEDLNVEEECNAILEEFYDEPHLYDWMLENCGDYYTWR